jgi:predicted regulator of Ras-like GTPase activity (Roadblock/LC7/MglB family)
MSQMNQMSQSTRPALAHPYETDPALDALLSAFVKRVPGATMAALSTRDGFLRACSDGMERVQGERASAQISGLSSLAQAFPKAWGLHGGPGSLRQLVMEFDGEDGYLALMAVGANSVLAAVGSAGADIGAIGAELARLVKQVQPHLDTPVREHAAAGAASSEAG